MSRMKKVISVILLICMTATLYIGVGATSGATIVTYDEYIDGLSGAKGRSFDTLYVKKTGESDPTMLGEDGKTGDYLAATTPANTIVAKKGEYASVYTRGWVGLPTAIDQFGYVIDNNTPVFGSGTSFMPEATGDDVRNAGGPNALRYRVEMDVSAIESGTHTLRTLVKLTDGTIISIVEFNYMVEAEAEPQISLPTATAGTGSQGSAGPGDYVGFWLNQTDNAYVTLTFNALASFNGVSMHLYAKGGGSSPYTLELFKFNTDVATTLSGTAVASKTGALTGDSNVDFDFDKAVDPGKYILRLVQTSRADEAYIVSQNRPSTAIGEGYFITETNGSAASPDHLQWHVNVKFVNVDNAEQLFGKLDAVISASRTIKKGEKLTVTYAGSTAAKDWVAVSKYGKFYQEYNGQGTVWAYCNSATQTAGAEVKASGTVELDTSALAAGEYDLYFFANDDYNTLSRLKLTITDGTVAPAPTGDVATFGIVAVAIAALAVVFVFKKRYAV